MLHDEIIHLLFHLRVLEPSVFTALDRVERGFHARILQGIVEDLTLLVRHQRILISMNDQKSSRVFGDVGQWIG